MRQLRQLSCILDSCTIAASYEVSQAQKSLLLMPRTAVGASTSSGELNAQVSPWYWGGPPLEVQIYTHFQPQKRASTNRTI